MRAEERPAALHKDPLRVCWWQSLRRLEPRGGTSPDSPWDQICTCLAGPRERRVACSSLSPVSRSSQQDLHKEFRCLAFKGAPAPLGPWQGEAFAGIHSPAYQSPCNEAGQPGA